MIEAAAASLGITTSKGNVTYYLGRESLVAGSGGAMGRVSEGIFRMLVRNALPATAYFRLPPEQVVEIGLQIDL